MLPRFRVLSNKNTLLPKLYLGFAVFSTGVSATLNRNIAIQELISAEWLPAVLDGGTRSRFPGQS